MTKPNVGQTVWYLESTTDEHGTELYREVRCGVIIGTRYAGAWIRLAGQDELKSAASCYATKEAAKKARLAYYTRRAKAAQKALDNARTHLSNMAGWRERAWQEMGGEQSDIQPLSTEKIEALKNRIRAAEKAKEEK